MKINNKMIEINSDYQFNNFGDFSLNFYLNETIPISLSYIFQNFTNIKEISFNENINKFTIIDMKGMFSGCSGLRNISFYPFEGKDLIDISYLFSDSDIKYVNLSFSKSNNLI